MPVRSENTVNWIGPILELWYIQSVGLPIDWTYDASNLSRNDTGGYTYS